ncbi:hypothetical protein UCREL1_8162 [Eutypa lata UCREL1]|uniref:Uncharacterized protein n=1 Tax=Eutypa lata (strain UCR-EL1) TaxID=1287681 RepID=M7TDV2_EUTLA|nr:hypothetical protein UCREL1_8162 [Eutypa lata UCREL1]
MGIYMCRHHTPIVTWSHMEQCTIPRTRRAINGRSPFQSSTATYPGPDVCAPFGIYRFSGSKPDALYTIPPSSTIPAGAGAGGPTLKSVYRNPEDLRRAQMQTTYNTLTPAERADQDAWATHKADEFAPCPFNFAWERDDHYPGYRCAGGAHYMSDMILAEGVPGLYARQDCHRGLKNWDRKPAELENVPPGMYGPVRPVGVDRKGKYTYFEGSVDGPLTLKRSRTEPVFDRW